MKPSCALWQSNAPFQAGNGMAVEEGKFVYPKASGPRFEFSDDESEEGDDDEDSADEDGHVGKDGRSSKKEAALEPKVCPLCCLSLPLAFLHPIPSLASGPTCEVAFL